MAIFNAISGCVVIYDIIVIKNPRQVEYQGARVT